MSTDAAEVKVECERAKKRKMADVARVARAAKTARVVKREVCTTISVLDAPDLFFNGYAQFLVRKSAGQADAQLHMRDGPSAETLARLAAHGNQPVGNVLAEAFFWYPHLVRLAILDKVPWFDPFCSRALSGMLDVTVNCVQLLDLARRRAFNFLTFVRLFCEAEMRNHRSVVWVLQQFEFHSCSTRPHSSGSLHQSADSLHNAGSPEREAVI